MSAADVMTTMTFPGLHRPFTKDDMKDFTAMYNGLQRIHPGMHVDMGHVKKLIEIIDRHDQLGKFCFHLVHRHDPIANDTVRLESSLGPAVPGKWNRAMPIDNLDLRNVHGVVFKFVTGENRFVPFEFCEGPSPITGSDVNGEFVREFSSYLAENNLTDIFALEVLHPVEEGHPTECTAEVEVENLGTVVLPKSMVNAPELFPTGWPAPFQPTDSDPPAGQTWAKMVDGNHKVFVNKSIESASELVNELVRQGVIKIACTHTLIVPTHSCFLSLCC